MALAWGPKKTTLALNQQIEEGREGGDKSVVIPDLEGLGCKQHGLDNPFDLCGKDSMFPSRHKRQYVTKQNVKEECFTKTFKTNQTSGPWPVPSDPGAL